MNWSHWPLIYLNTVTENHRRYQANRRLPALDPAKELGERIDLVVVAASWKRKEFCFEIFKPGRLSRQEELSGLNLG